MSLDRLRGCDPRKRWSDEIATGAGGAGLRSIVARGASPARLPAKWARDSAGRERILSMFAAHATPCRIFYCAGRGVARSCATDDGGLAPGGRRSDVAAKCPKPEAGKARGPMVAAADAGGAGLTLAAA